MAVRRSARRGDPCDPRTSVSWPTTSRPRRIQPGGEARAEARRLLQGGPDAAPVHRPAGGRGGEPCPPGEGDQADELGRRGEAVAVEVRGPALRQRSWPGPGRGRPSPGPGGASRPSPGPRRRVRDEDGQPFESHAAGDGLHGIQAPRKVDPGEPGTPGLGLATARSARWSPRWNPSRRSATVPDRGRPPVARTRPAPGIPSAGPGPGRPMAAEPPAPVRSRATVREWAGPARRSDARAPGSGHRARA